MLWGPVPTSLMNGCMGLVWVIRGLRRFGGGPVLGRWGVFAHVVVVEAGVLAPFAIGDGRDFGGLDLATAAPEDGGVVDGDAGLSEVFIDGGFVGEDAVFLRAVRDAHDVDVVKLGSTFAPVGVGHDVVPPDLATGIEFAAGAHGPVEEGVVAGDALITRDGFDVFEERGEAPDQFLLLEAFGDAEEVVERDAGFGGAGCPEVVLQFVDREFPLERGENTPLEVVELDDVRREDIGRIVRTGTGSEVTATGVSDAEAEEALGRHDAKLGGADVAGKVLAVFGERKPLGHFERGPKVGSGRRQWRRHWCG